MFFSSEKPDTGSYTRTVSSRSKGAAARGAALDNGNLTRFAGNSKGTGSLSGQPLAKKRKRSGAATANPDGRVNRASGRP